MIREPEFSSGAVADIVLTTCQFEGVDIPLDMFHQDGMICFWANKNTLMFIPITEVRSVQIRTKST